MLRTDGSRFKRQYIAVADDSLVERGGRVKGYEFAKGQYVLCTDVEVPEAEINDAELALAVQLVEH